MSVLLLCLIQPLQNGVARGALGWSGQDRGGSGVTEMLLPLYVCD